MKAAQRDAPAVWDGSRESRIRFRPLYERRYDGAAILLAGIFAGCVLNQTTVILLKQGLLIAVQLIIFAPF
jgi:hypothetical protein